MTNRIVGLMPVFLGLAVAGVALISLALEPPGGVEVPRWPLGAGMATMAIGVVIAVYRSSSHD
jgi:hypothetical protein